jgi:hypothetical protein
MQAGPVRLTETTISGCVKKALRAGLRDLEKASVAVRYDLSDTVRHVEFHLTEDLKDTVSDLLAKLPCAGELIAKRGSYLKGDLFGGSTQNADTTVRDSAPRKLGGNVRSG